MLINKLFYGVVKMKKLKKMWAFKTVDGLVFSKKIDAVKHGVKFKKVYFFETSYFWGVISIL